MNKETKEVILYLKKKENTRRIKCITLEKAHYLLDYISKLEKENKEIINKINEITYKGAMIKVDYKSRINKAIEYINKNIADIEYMKNNYDMNQLKTFTIEITYDGLENILNILQGGDEN